MQSQSGASGAELMRLYQVRISNTLYPRISNSTLYREQIIYFPPHTPRLEVITSYDDDVGS